MYREMRRKDRQLSCEKLEAILQNGEYGILGTVSKTGYPYTVPVHYVYFDENIYFHCAVDGQKIDNIKENDKVSFCVVGSTKVLPEKFSTLYESTIVFGTASIIDGDEKIYAFKKLILKYSPDFVKEGDAYIKNAASKTCVIKIKIEHKTAKGRVD